jgi:molecular chaperone GrpE (heat shock protein)
LKTLKEILKRNNVLKIEISQLIFSDQLCEVAGIISIPDMADNTVYKIVKNGYMCGTVLLRKAGVILVKNPSENSSAEFNEAELR